MVKKTKRVTLQDVAREAGVSPMTVSRVINNTGRISDETRKYIREVVNRMGYRPSRVARSLVTNKTFLIGLIVPDITNTFFSEIVHGVEDIAWEKGYSVLLANTSENPPREEAVLRQLQEAIVDGVIVCSSRLPDDELIELIRPYQAVVTINRPVPQRLASQVRIDPDAMPRWARAAHFLMERGRRRIAYLCLHRSQIRGTLDEFLELFGNAGLDVKPDWYVSCIPTWESGYKHTQELLAAYPEIDGIIGGNDLLALGALRAAKELGRSVPDSLAITGADDILLAREIDPPLTTFTMPKREIGVTAAKLLFSRIEGDKAYEEAFYREDLIVRKSTP
jgi:LacI family transcriptional regulator